MASKVLVKIPAVNFNSQVNQCTADLVSISISGGNTRAPAIDNAQRSTGETGTLSVNSDPALYITQLEQNLKFLKEQHHLMLTSLHHEVETLRQRNRDLQFQLVFSRGSLALVKSSPSSPEDDSKPQVVLSPKKVNVTPLQIELLERDISELRSSLNESKTRNTCLENIIDEQKMQLENATKQTTSDNHDENSGNPDPDLVLKLEEAEKIIRRLRRENDEQRRELAMIKANQSKVQVTGGTVASAPHHRATHHWPQQHQREYHQVQRDQHHHDQHQHHQHREQFREQQRDQRDQCLDQQREVMHDTHYDQHEQTRDGTRFPPLSTPKYWHNSGGQRGRWNNSWESNRGGGVSRMLNQSLPSLPGLPHGSISPNPAANSNPCSAPFALLSHGNVGGRRIHRGNFRGERGGGRGGNSSAQAGGRGYWDQSREHRGRERDRHRDQGFVE